MKDKDSPTVVTDDMKRRDDSSRSISMDLVSTIH